MEVIPCITWLVEVWEDEFIDDIPIENWEGAFIWFKDNMPSLTKLKDQPIQVPQSIVEDKPEELEDNTDKNVATFA